MFAISFLFILVPSDMPAYNGNDVNMIHASDDVVSLGFASVHFRQLFVAQKK